MSTARALSRTLSCILVALFLAACTPKLPPQGPPAGPEALWSLFRSRALGAEVAPESFLMRGSIVATRGSRTNRIVFQFWGALDSTLRLDLTAGVGAPIAYFREAPEGFLALYPGDNKAFTAASGRRGFAALGVATPFSLRELALVLGGRLALLVPEQYERAELDASGAVTYHFPRGSRIESLTLGEGGLPTEATGPEGLRLDLSGYGTDADLPTAAPGLAAFELGPENKAVVRIKSVEARPGWDENLLRLTPPPGTEVSPLG